MKPLGSTARTWLKSIHAVFAAIWTGAGVCMILLMVGGNPATGGELHGINSALKLIDDFVIIPAAIGSLLTGLLISLLTRWGFFKYHWVTVKWVVTVAIILSGTFLLGPWLNGMEAISESERMAALTNPTYRYNQQMLLMIGSLQPVALVFLIILSLFKPWMRKKS
jgi:flagellar biosynthesis protein FliQ